MIWVKLFNTASKRKETVMQPTGKLSVYACGPTVYSPSTLGNWRTFLIYDFLVKILRHCGYQVKWAMNYTDVGHLTSDGDTGEDKIAAQAKKERKDAWAIADENIQRFELDKRRLNIASPDQVLRATAEIVVMIELIKRLEAKGYTYKINDGIYFDTAKFPAYGRLARLDQTGMQAGARVEQNLEKRQPSDFALWKFSPVKSQRDMEWPSPWGVGFPGWHIECSAMANKVFGATVDLHLGGIDLLTTHHQNELAQSESASGQQFVNYWVHIEHLLIEGKRMGKSEGNAYTLTDLDTQGFDPLDFRYFVMTANYRQKQNFSWEALAAAHQARQRLAAKLAVLPVVQLSKVQLSEQSKIDEQFEQQVLNELANDLNLPGALAAVWDYLVRAKNKELVRSTILHLDKTVFNFGLAELIDKLGQTDQIPAEIEHLLSDRKQAREEQDYQRADKIRQQLLTKGYIIEDTKTGTQVKFIHGKKKASAKKD